MSKIAIIVKLTARPGHRDSVLEALDPMFDQVEQEPGTEVYTMHVDEGDADVVWFYELYADADAAGAHGAGDVLAAVGAALGDHLAQRPEIVYATPVRGKGLDA